jgi:hypothetical protein
MIDLFKENNTNLYNLSNDPTASKSGRKYSTVTRKKMSEIHKGKTIREETRQKI